MILSAMKLNLIFRYVLVSICLFVSILLPSCKKEDKFPVYYDQGTIGGNGGIVKTDDGASVEIPAGAMSTDQTISVAKNYQDNNPVNNVCRIYRFKPDGLFFNDSVLISLPFDDKYIDYDNSAKNYGISIFYNNGTYWEKCKTIVDLKNKVARIKSLHFSDYYIEYLSASQ
jgi:hypothetical protein